MKGCIARIVRYSKKALPGVALSEARLVADGGLADDMHFGTDRPLSIFSEEARDWMHSQPVKGLCFGRYRENLLVSGLDLCKLECGDRLAVGQAVLRITKSGKRCFEDCALLRAGEQCRLHGEAFFAAVEHGGIIHIGQEITIV